jgi:putative peptide zinc metalloprotease protein
VQRDAGWCGSCGQPLADAGAPFELLLGDGTRIPVIETISIGRAATNTLRLDDPSVSRAHARIVVGDGAPRLEEAGSSHGTWVDGRRLAAPARLTEGMDIRLGDVKLVVRLSRPEEGAGQTILVRAGQSVVLPAAGRAVVASHTTGFGTRPRVRRGWALKRLPASEGERRFVLRDLEGGDFLRLDAVDAALFELLDGEHSLSDLIAEAERRSGAEGSARLARLLADLGERGLLERAPGSGQQHIPPSGLARLVRPREWAFPWVPEAFDRLYRAGGFVLFTPAALVALAVVAVAGLAAFAYLVAERYGTPFVVAGKLGLGGLVFLAGRFLLVALHETAHGVTMASFGRRVGRGGLKLLVVFPYAFVDTSEAYFEPRRRRMAVSAAGPASDLALGGAFALACAALDAGPVRDVLFQLAFAGYAGALLNLNPFLDRDGYHLLVDAVREPGLRRRSREELARRLTGMPAEEDASRAAWLYGVAALGWSFVASGVVLLLARQYHDRLVELVPSEVFWVGVATVCALILLPAVLQVALPVSRRRDTVRVVDRAGA